MCSFVAALILVLYTLSVPVSLHASISGNFSLSNDTQLPRHRMYAMCPPEFQHIGSKCYLLHNQNSSWLEAQFICKNKNARLAQPLQRTDRKLRTFLNKHDSQNELNDLIWIGAKYNSINQDWHWYLSRKKPIGNAFNELGKKFGNNYCAAYDPNLSYKLAARVCLEKHRFICQHKMFKVFEENRFKVYERWNATYPNQLVNEILLEDLRIKNRGNRSYDILAFRSLPYHTTTTAEVSSETYSTSTTSPEIAQSDSYDITSSAPIPPSELTQEDLKLKQDREKELELKEQNNLLENAREEQDEKNRKEEEEEEIRQKEHRRKEDRRVQQKHEYQEIAILNEILNRTSEMIMKMDQDFENVDKFENKNNQIEKYVDEIRKKITQLTFIYTKTKDPVTEPNPTLCEVVGYNEAKAEQLDEDKPNHKEIVEKKAQENDELEPKMEQNDNEEDIKPTAEAERLAQEELKRVIIEIYFKKKQIEYEEYVINYLLLKRANLLEEEKREERRREKDKHNQQLLREHLLAEYEEFKRLEHERHQLEENYYRLKQQEEVRQKAIMRHLKEEDELNAKIRRSEAERRNQDELKRIAIEAELKTKQTDYENSIINYLLLKKAELPEWEQHTLEVIQQPKTKYEYEELPFIQQEHKQQQNAEHDLHPQQENGSHQTAINQHLQTEVRNNHEYEEGKAHTQEAQLVDQIIHERRNSIVKPEAKKVQIDFMEEINNVFTYMPKTDPPIESTCRPFVQDHQIRPIDPLNWDELNRFIVEMELKQKQIDYDKYQLMIKYLLTKRAQLAAEVKREEEPHNEEEHYQQQFMKQLQTEYNDLKKYVFV